MRKRRVVVGHGFHSLCGVSFQQNSRVDESRIGRECVEGIESNTLSLDVVGHNADWEHHIDGVMLRTNSIVYSITVDDGESRIVCYVRGCYHRTDG